MSCVFVRVRWVPRTAKCRPTPRGICAPGCLCLSKDRPPTSENALRCSFPSFVFKRPAFTKDITVRLCSSLHLTSLSSDSQKVIIIPHSRSVRQFSAPPLPSRSYKYTKYICCKNITMDSFEHHPTDRSRFWRESALGSACSATPLPSPLCKNIPVIIFCDWAQARNFC